MSRDFLIHNGKLTSDLDADGNQIKNLPGVAHLVDGKVPSDELPSYVDDVLEYATRTSFPATGERGKIYVALDTNKTYRWSGTTYVEIAGTPTLDDAVTRTSANGVKSSGIWAAIWGALTALPTGFSSLYDWVVAQLSGKASTADATLTERYGSTETAQWTITYPQGWAHGTVYITWFDEFAPIGWVADCDGDRFGPFSDNPNATTLTGEVFGETITATRTALPGYQLGAQANKPLASEAEAEALRTAVAGKQDALTSAQLANIADVPNKANAADLRYSLNTATVTPGSSVWTANYSQIYDKHGELVDVNLPEWGTYSTPDGDKTGWFWYDPEMVYNLLSEDESATLLTVEWDGYDGEEYVFYTINFSKTTSPATVTNVKDRAINAVALSGNATLTPPSQVSGKSRDFFLSVANSGSSNATVTVSGAALIDPAMNAVTLVAKPSAITTWRLTEMVNSSGSLIPATFVVAGANQISSSDVVDPATATASGKAADALATKNALAAKQAALTSQQIANIAAVPDKANRSQIAPDYSASSTYAVGDRVFHDGVLYVCSTAISTAEAWTAAHWTAETVAETFDDIADGLDEVIGGMGTLPVIYSVDDALSSSSTNPVQNRVITAALRYSFNAATVGTGTTPTVTNVLDRAINYATLGSTVTAATVTLPAATTGRSRDFYIDLTIEATDAPTLTFIDPATGTTAVVKFGASALADIAPGYNLVLFTELPNNRWLVSVKHEEAA